MDTTPRPIGLPTSIDIGPHTWVVSADELDHLRQCRARHGDLLGSSDNRQLLITVDAHQARSQMSDTVLHEVLHAVAAMTGLDADWGKDEESIICRLTPALLDVLRRNPQLVGFLLELEAT